MKVVSKPFALGVGAPPPELAGRYHILNKATLAIEVYVHF